MQRLLLAAGVLVSGCGRVGFEHPAAVDATPPTDAADPDSAIPADTGAPDAMTRPDASEPPDDGSIDPGMVATLSARLPRPTTRLSCAASSATGSIFCFGGRDEANQPLDVIVEFDPGTHEIRDRLATLPTPRFFLSCAEHRASGTVFCLGGEDAFGMLDEVVRYDPIMDAVTIMTARLPYPRRLFHACTPMSTSILCGGGMRAPDDAIDEIIVYDPELDTIEVDAAVLPSTMRYHGCATAPMTDIAYCLRRRELVALEPGAMPRTLAIAPDVDAYFDLVDDGGNRLFSFGGTSSPGVAIDSILGIDLTRGTAETVAVLPEPTIRHGCARAPDGNDIYCFGGHRSDADPARDWIIRFSPL